MASASRWKQILEQIGVEEPIPKDPRGTIESVLGDEEFMAKDHEFTKLFTKTKDYQDVYESKLSSSLIASTMIGNLYTASLYLGFRSSLEFEYQKGVDLEDKRIGFGSYGSGSSAMVFQWSRATRIQRNCQRYELGSRNWTKKKIDME